MSRRKIAICKAFGSGRRFLGTDVALLADDSTWVLSVNSPQIFTIRTPLIATCAAFVYSGSAIPSTATSGTPQFLSPTVRLWPGLPIMSPGEGSGNPESLNAASAIDAERRVGPDLAARFLPTSCEKRKRLRPRVQSGSRHGRSVLLAHASPFSPSLPGTRCG